MSRWIYSVFPLVLIGTFALNGCGKKKPVDDDDDDKKTQIKREEASKAPSTSTSVSGAVGEAKPVVAATLPQGETLVEEHDLGKVAFRVTGDGDVKAQVALNDNKAPAAPVTGQLEWKNSLGEGKVPLAPDSKTPFLIGTAPKFPPNDLTELRYTIQVDGKPWVGTLHLPAGGTIALNEGATIAVKKTVPEGKKGPNGGIIQVVGNDYVEVVADQSSKQVRVFVLDDDFKPIVIGQRKMKLAFAGDSPEVVEVAPSPDAMYFVGTARLKVNPVKITVSMTVGTVTHVALVGYRPGTTVVVSHRARPHVVLVRTPWIIDVRAPHPGIHVESDVHIHVHGHGHGHKKGHWKWKH